MEIRSTPTLQIHWPVAKGTAQPVGIVRAGRAAPWEGPPKRELTSDWLELLKALTHCPAPSVYRQAEDRLCKRSQQFAA
eukprot:2338716-Alexandrium_andersonii.AAC.1